MASQLEIRRKVLEALYRCHKAEAFCPMKTRDLIETLGLIDEQEFFDAIQFLHDESFINGIFVPYQRQGHFESARITQKGVDLVDRPAEMEKAFPTHSIGGKVDKFVEDFRREVNATDLSKEEKERLHEFITTPVVSDIISRIMPQKK